MASTGHSSRAAEARSLLGCVAGLMENETAVLGLVASEIHRARSRGRGRSRCAGGVDVESTGNVFRDFLGSVGHGIQVVTVALRRTRLLRPGWTDLEAGEGEVHLSLSGGAGGRSPAPPSSEFPWISLHARPVITKAFGLARRHDRAAASVNFRCERASGELRSLLSARAWIWRIRSLETPSARLTWTSVWCRPGQAVPQVENHLFPRI